MAAAQRRKKKTQGQKRKTQQTTLQKPQAKRKKSQPQPGRWKPALKRLRKSPRKRHFTTFYISEMMSRLQPGHRRMSAKAKGLMNSSMCNLYSGVFTEANRRRKKRRGSFIGTSEVEAAMEKVMKVTGNSTSSIHTRSC